MGRSKRKQIIKKLKNKARRKVVTLFDANVRDDYFFMCGSKKNETDGTVGAVRDYVKNTGRFLVQAVRITLLSSFLHLHPTTMGGYQVKNLNGAMGQKKSWKFGSSINALSNFV